MKTPSADQLSNLTDDATLGQRLTPILLLILSVAVVFGRSVTFGVFWDDSLHLTANPWINPPSWDGLVNIWTQPFQGLYIPLSYTYFWLLATIAGVPPESGTWLFHLSTLVLHTACTLLVYGILRRLVGGNRWAAFFGAALFAIHPLQTESVVWISETRGLLAAIFSLLSIRFYLSYLDRCKSAREWTDRGVMLVASIVVFLLALLCKPAAVAVPIILAILAIGMYQRKITTTLFEMVPFLTFVTVTALVSLQQQPAGQLPWVPPIWVRPFLALDAIAFYLGKLIWPHPLAADYGYEPSWMITNTWAFFIWLIPVALLIVAVVSRHRRTLLVCGGLFVAWLLPVLGLLPFAFQRISLVADRYVYLAMLGPALLVATIIARSETWSAGRRLATICTGTAMLVIFATLSFVQSGYWSDNITFLTHTQKVNPRSTVAGDNFARIAHQEGRYQDALRIYRSLYKEHPRREMICKNLAAILGEMGKSDEAFDILTKAVERSPDWPQVRCALAQLQSARGLSIEAEENYKEALKLDPISVQALVGLGIIEQHRSRPLFAVKYYQNALMYDPNNLVAMSNMAVAYEAMGLYEKAIEWYQRAIETAPKNAPSHYNLGNALAKLGRQDEAIESYMKAIDADSLYIPAYIDAAFQLLNKKEYEEARQLLVKASTIDPNNANVYLNLGILFIETKNYEEARTVFLHARSLLHENDSRHKSIDTYLNLIDKLMHKTDETDESTTTESTDQPPIQEPEPMPVEEIEPLPQFLVPPITMPPAEETSADPSSEAAPPPLPEENVP